MKKMCALCIVVLGFCVTPPLTTVAAEKKAKGQEIKKPEVPEYLLLMVKGNDAYILKDYDRAMALYREAASKSPKNPRVVYLIACVQRALKRYDDAVDSFKTAYLLASEDDWIKGVALVGVAMTYEAAGKLVEAASAWEDLKRFASGKPGLGEFISVAESRLRANERLMELQKASKKVRERIAAESSS